MEQLRGARIVVLDDSKSFLAGLRDLLEQVGCHVLTFSKPLQAIAEIGNHPVDIWVVDYEMPQMNGIEFIRLLRMDENFKDIPVLMLTGRTQADILVEAIKAGADAFVEKSKITETLTAQLLALLRLKAIYKKILQAKQLDAIKALIGTYKHEFGNALAIASGKLWKLEKNHPELNRDEAMKSVKDALSRIETVLKKLDDLRKYEVSDYVDELKILKVG